MSSNSVQQFETQPSESVAEVNRMRPEIAECSEIMFGPDGERFLCAMRCAYFGDHDGAWKNGETWVSRAEEIGLLKVNGRRLTLTPSGYLIGNVAKEYCNYLDQGHQVVGPKPPVEFYSGKDVLDLGCAFGRWLWHFQRQARSAVGIEMQAEYVQLGETLAKREGVPVPRLIRGSIEDLDRHIPPQSMDLVFSRLVFNHVAIRPTLKKAILALRPGGILWLELGPFRVALTELFNSEPRFRSKVLTAFQLFNSLLCPATSWQMTVRSKGRMHLFHKLAYPTVNWWRRTLSREGLTDFTIVSYSPQAVAFFARKPSR